MNVTSSLSSGLLVIDAGKRAFYVLVNFNVSQLLATSFFRSHGVDCAAAGGQSGGGGGAAAHQSARAEGGHQGAWLSWVLL
jgi:hypothetical protein